MSLGPTLNPPRPCKQAADRRMHERVRLQPMYAGVVADLAGTPMHGHAYDISESGVRIELDDALPVGQAVNLHVELPGTMTEVTASADVVWVNDAEDDPGPRRMALRFVSFPNAADRQRLIDFIAQGLQRAVAA